MENTQDVWFHKITRWHYCKKKDIKIYKCWDKVRFLFYGGLLVFASHVEVLLLALWWVSEIECKFEYKAWRKKSPSCFVFIQPGKLSDPNDVLRELKSIWAINVKCINLLWEVKWEILPSVLRVVFSLHLYILCNFFSLCLCMWLVYHVRYFQ